MSKPWQNMPQKQQQQVNVNIDLAKEWIMCPCGGRGIFMPAAFCPKNQPFVGQPPQAFPVNVIMCSQCGEPIKQPWKVEGDIKEAS